VKKTFLFLAAIVLSAVPLWAATSGRARLRPQAQAGREAMLLIVRISRVGLDHAHAEVERDDRDRSAGKARAGRQGPGAFDVPPRGFTFAIKLVRAARRSGRLDLARDRGLGRS